MDFVVLFITISLIIIFSPMLSNIFNTPVVVIEILLGIMGGYVGFLDEGEEFKTIAHFGFLYLMFLAGLEINMQLLDNIKKKMFFSVLGYFIMLYLLAFILSLVFNLNLIYTAVLPIFSLGMLTILLKEYGKNELWLNLALTIGVIGELISILILTFISGWLELGIGKEFYLLMGSVVGVLIFGTLLIKMLKHLFENYPRLKDLIMPFSDRMDQDIRISVSLFFIFISIMMYLKIDLVLGAFAAGLILKLYFYEHEILIEKLASFGFGFFVPIFFIYTGSTLHLDMIDIGTLKHALFIMGAIIAIRLISSYAVFYRYLGTKQTLLFSLSDSMPLTFLIAVSMVAYQYHFIAQSEYYAFIIAAMLDGLVLMTLIRRLYK